MKDIKSILKDIQQGTPIEDIVKMLKEKGFGRYTEKTPIKSEEEYCELLEQQFNFGSDEYYDLDESFWAYENFFPENKSVGEGAWIKVKTEIGYNVYFAKRTIKRFNKLDVQRKIKNQSNQADKILEIAQNTVEHDEALVIIEKGMKKVKSNKDLCKELMRAEMLEELELEPYCVKYRVSKSTWKTVMPCDYEMISDIEAYVKTISELGKTEAVTYKSIFTYLDENIIFYLQSRGISRDTAIMLAKLKDCYFICNVPKMFEMWMQPVNKNDELVEV